MTTGTELKILKFLLNDLTVRYSILQISKSLQKPYPQIYKAVQTLKTKRIITLQTQGKSSLLEINISATEELITAEFQRRDEHLHNYKILKVLLEDIQKIVPVQYICILFGSYAKSKATSHSDIDLLLVIPSQENYAAIEKNARAIITVPKVDLNIITEQSLLEMWQRPGQLNVGNELLTGHIIFQGAEAFLQLRRVYYGK